ncbi:hypothetical protein B5S28_g1294 [[Candida] boidinii]|uniref:Unnamed protein product n=1 Tax=Candida boidinii TaxID=5477 RepID=A0ACB5TGL9_CANBO|nr:hypothetical protein B5S28_g1294 [[Candida] boidinii]OWB60753.1 hypothetical protein B5S29_g1634 [[Candida] boidinii]OWB70859.1 hypothetical protein B5S31_g540 [[Candida] boidinii]OWB76748.1 hypothetical protein B5S32_g903 [[Candida] boidinii]GME87870.1 unnamed protein product [[Candida] boidinii]
MSKPFDPETADNMEEIEMQFAVKAVQQSETYWNLLSSIPGSKLKLTKYDDLIYEKFIQHFPEYKNPENVRVLVEDDMKTKDAKERWREFIHHFEYIEDFNFGTLLRLSSDGEYDQAGTMFAVRIQFYAIEIVRNKHKLNDWICKKN